MWVYAGARMPTQPGLSRAARQASAEFIRASLQGESPLLKLSSKLGAIPLAQRTLYLTVWHQGVPLARFSATSYTLGEALGVLSRKIRARRHSIPNEVNVTLKFDFIVGRRQIRTFPKPLFALSLRPGIDGLRVSHAHSERAILPDDFIRADVYGAAPVVPGIAELRLGVDPDWALRQLKLEPHEQLERIRLQSWTINSTGTYLLSRGNSHGPHPSAEAFRKAALKGGEFVLRQITPEHTFHYVYLPYEDQYPSAAGYSIARHAGTVYSLLLLYQHSQQERFRQGAYDTLSWLMSIVNTPCLVAQGACVPEYGVASLGSAALSAIAALEYQRSTHDVQFEKQANALLEFIITMQTRDGDFRHFFSLQDQRVDLLGKTMFYSEEAALALVLGYKVFKNAAYLKAAERALDFLTQDKYRFFLGWFIYGADHWTCIAAQEAWPELKEPHYLEFCRGYAAFLRKLQYEPGEWDQDFVGHYGFSALLVPQAGAAAGFTEALISTYELGRYHGVYDARILRQIELGLSALLREQLRPDNSYLVKVPERALGGFRRSLVESDIRIDFTQHAMSALIRGAQLSYNKQSI
jgi:hypothetical protein